MPENVRSEENQKLTAKQEMLVAALLVNPSITAAAKALNVNERTIRRWLDMPHVQAAYEQAREAVFNNALTLLQQAASVAVRTLLSCMKDDVAPGIRLRAAQIILEQSIQLLVNKAKSEQVLGPRVSSLREE